MTEGPQKFDPKDIPDDGKTIDGDTTHLNDEETTQEQDNAPVDEKTEQLAKAQSELDAARARFEKANIALEKAQAELDELDADENAYQTYTTLLAQLEEEKLAEQEKLKEYKNRLEALTTDKAQNDAKLAEYQAQINKINTVLNRTNLKEETKAAREAEKTAIQAQYDELAKTIENPKSAEEIKAEGDQITADINDTNKNISEIDAEIAETNASIETLIAKGSFEDRRISTTFNYELAKDEQAEAKASFFSARKAYAALKGVNWGSVAKNVATAVVVGALVSTALTPLGASALIVSPISAVISSTIGSIRKNKEGNPNISWSDAAKEAFAKDNATDTRKKIALAAGFGLISGGLIDSGAIDSIKETISGLFGGSAVDPSGVKLGDVTDMGGDKPDVVVEKPAIVADKPDVVIEKPAVVADKPDVVIEKPAIVADKPDTVADCGKQYCDRIEPTITTVKVAPVDAITGEPIILPAAETVISVDVSSAKLDPSKLIDAGILLDGKAANDMGLINQFIAAAKEFGGVDEAAIKAVEAKMASADFVMSADSVKVVGAYADSLTESLKDGTLTVGEYQKALSTVFEKLADPDTNFVTKVAGKVLDTETYAAAAKKAANAAMASAMKLAA